MVNAAVAGLGWWGRQITRSLRGSTRLRLVRAVEPNVAAHAEFAREHGLPLSGSLAEALADPAVEAVILCTPHALHAAQVLEVAAAGRHVFCEKPLALSRADAERCVAACRAAGVLLGIGHERRFEPAVRRLRELLRAGELGTVLHARADFSHDKLAHITAGDWRADPAQAPAASMTAMGVHLTDLFLDLVGPIEEVHAITTHLVSSRKNGDGVSVHLRFASGATGHVHAVLETPLYISLTIMGSGGWAEIRNESHPDTPGPATLTVQPRGGERRVETFAWENATLLNLLAFVEAVEGGADYPFTDAQKVGNIAVLEAVARSAASREPVRL
jgi:predicted dehydrogenase